MLKRKNLYIIIYFIIITIASLIHISIIQNILLIMCSFTLNLIMFYKLDIKSDKYKYVSLGIIIINIMLIYFNYHNLVTIRFSDGLPYGQIGKYLYYDSYEYYYQGIRLGDLWLNGGFKDWILGNIPNNYVERGVYNYFVVFNSFIRILFGKDLVTWMIIKYQFSIMSIALMYKISSNFVRERYSLISLIIFNFYPGYLLINGDLLRDNFISFFVILTSYIVIKGRYDKKVEWIKIIFILFIVTYLRVYIGIILAISIFVYLCFDKLNVREVISYSIVFIITIFIVGKIMEFCGYGFLGVTLLQSGDIQAIQWDSQSVNSPVKLCLKSLYLIFLGGRTSISGNYDYVLNLYNDCAPIFIAIISLPTVLSVVFIRTFSKEQRKFIVFSFVFTILSATIITYGFSSIIARLYACWFWSQCIVFVMLISNISKLEKAENQLLKIEYVLYILFILIGFTKWNV